MGLRRSWDAYNIAKARRFMERTAQFHADRPCEDCGGRGVDLGSLYEPEPCPSCAGSGKLIAPEISRKQPGAAISALSDPVNLTAAGRTKAS